MQILLSCAKTMKASSKLNPALVTTPHFAGEAAEIALHMSQFSVKELEQLLRVNSKIAVENYKQYQEFHTDENTGIPAILAYIGIVFKRLNPGDFTAQDFQYAQEHLRLTSFCYGLLRPLDAIRPYRLEGNIRLLELGDQNLFSYWQPRLTGYFIEEIKQQGGVLCNLASDEMKGLFDWSKVVKETKVITPEFHTWRNSKLTTIVIYTKMARGEMTRYIIKNRITDPEELKAFSWEGFEYKEDLSGENRMVFVNG